MKRLKKVSEDILFENPWHVYKHDIYETPDGSQGNYYYLETPGAACVVPVMPDGTLLLTLQHRYLDEKQSIEFPGGGLKKDLSVIDGAKQELLEETGCAGDEWVKVHTFQPSNGCIKDETHVFVAYVATQGGQQMDTTEDIELLYRRPDEIEDMIRRGDIWDGQTLATWALVRHRFLEEEQTMS